MRSAGAPLNGTFYILYCFFIYSLICTILDKAIITYVNSYSTPLKYNPRVILFGAEDCDKYLSIMLNVF